MNFSKTIFTMPVIMVLLVGIGLGVLQQQYSFAAEKPDPCKAFKELTKYVEILGLQAVGKGDENAMSDLMDDFRHYADLIMDVPEPDNGKC